MLKTENNPGGEGQPESGYEPTRSRMVPVMLIVISLYTDVMTDTVPDV